MSMANALEGVFKRYNSNSINYQSTLESIAAIIKSSETANFQEVVSSGFLNRHFSSLFNQRQPVNPKELSFLEAICYCGRKTFEFFSYTSFTSSGLFNSLLTRLSSLSSHQSSSVLDDGIRMICCIIGFSCNGNNIPKNQMDLPTAPLIRFLHDFSSKSSSSSKAVQSEDAESISHVLSALSCLLHPCKEHLVKAKLHRHVLPFVSASSPFPPIVKAEAFDVLHVVNWPDAGAEELALLPHLYDDISSALLCEEYPPLITNALTFLWILGIGSKTPVPFILAHSALPTSLQRCFCDHTHQGWTENALQVISYLMSAAADEKDFFAATSFFFVILLKATLQEDNDKHRSRALISCINKIGEKQVHFRINGTAATGTGHGGGGGAGAGAGSGSGPGASLKGDYNWCVRTLGTEGIDVIPVVLGHWDHGPPSLSMKELLKVGII